MRALKLVIPGDYWDVQIYRGMLYLWTMAGSILTLDWNHLVDVMADGALSPMAVRLAFKAGEVLYSAGVKPLLAEPEFCEWLSTVFDTQREQQLLVPTSMLDSVIVDEQENPLRDFHSDCEIYNRNLYAVLREGLFRASVGQTVRPISTRPEKLHDVPAVSVRANRRSLALAAADEGLFEWALDGFFEGSRNPGSDDAGLRHLSPRHCEKADWVFSSIFATSTLGGGYLVGRYWRREQEYTGAFLNRDQAPTRPRERVVGESDGLLLLDGGIFGAELVQGSLPRPTLSWGRNEKIHTANAEHLTSSRLSQTDLPRGLRVASVGLGEISLAAHGGNDAPIAGGAAYFGTIVEFDRSLVLISSSEEQSVIGEPVTRWRTYPRAVHYENHLHLVLDDRLEIYAFYGDYLADQRHKRFGVEYRAERRGWAPAGNSGF